MDFGVDVASQKQIVVLEDVLVESSLVTLRGVKLAIKEDKLVTFGEKVTLCAHAETKLRVVVDLGVPGLSDDGQIV